MKIFTKIIVIITAMIFVITMSGCSKVKDTKAARGSITGKVFDSNGKILPGAKVEIYGGSMSTVTDVMGEYVLSGLDSGQYKIVATNASDSVIIVVDVVQGETTENCNLTFKVSDNLPPLITLVTISKISENIATITWTTNEPSDSTIDYGIGPVGLPYNMSASDYGMVTNHSVALTGLKPGQTYHFRAKSRDFNKNEGVSSDYQFTTPTGDAPETPQGFGVSISSATEKLYLTWISNTESDLAGYNLYRKDTFNGSFAKVNASPIATAPAAVDFTDEGLKIGKKYYYYLKAVDFAGNESQPTEIVSAVTPGILDENRTWTLADSPFILRGDLRVRGGSVLTIQPGVSVEFSQSDAAPDSLGASMSELIIQGGLMAQGTVSQPITFTSAERFPRKSTWGGIIFSGTTQAENIMRNCVIMFADFGVKSEGATPSVENCEFGYCGIGIDSGLSTSLNIKGNTIRDCEIGITSFGSNIRNNIFAGNGIAALLIGTDFFEYNTVDSIIGIEVGGGKPNIKNNIFVYNSNTRAIYGINQSTALATPTISYNDFYNIALPYNGVTVSTGTTNITENPMFVGGVPYSYQLQADSPCLKAGENYSQLGAYGP